MNKIEILQKANLNEKVKVVGWPRAEVGVWVTAHS